MQHLSKPAKVATFAKTNSVEDTARKFGISETTVKRYVREQRTVPDTVARTAPANSANHAQTKPVSIAAHALGQINSTKIPAKVAAAVQATAPANEVIDPNNPRANPWKGKTRDVVYAEPDTLHVTPTEREWIEKKIGMTFSAWYAQPKPKMVEQYNEMREKLGLKRVKRVKNKPTIVTDMVKNVMKNPNVANVPNAIQEEAVVTAANDAVNTDA